MGVMETREAVVGDLESIFGLLKEFEELLEVKLSKSVFIPSWSSLIEVGAGGILLAEDAEGKIIGVLGYIMQNCINSGELQISEAFWFVSAEYRKGLVGLKLFKRLEKLTKDIGATKLYMVHLTSSMPEKLKSFYIKNGYKELETVYFKNFRSKG